MSIFHVIQTLLMRHNSIHRLNVVNFRNIFIRKSKNLLIFHFSIYFQTLEND